MTTRHKPVLLTGAPRSGSTFTGRMLAASPELYYVHEPFNPHSKDRDHLGRLQFERHFTYLHPGNEGRYRKDIARVVDGEFDFWHALTAARKPAQFKRAFELRGEFANRRASGQAPLLKDPIALMSAGWLADQFDLDCVVTVRHPGAFVASIDRLNWDSKPFRWALSQPALMADVFGEFEEELKALEADDADVVERAAMAWKLHHYVIAGYKTRYPNWHFIRHEDLSAAPLETFRGLYESLGLTWTDAAETTIQEHTSSANPDAAEGRDKALKLNSAAAVGGWKAKLDASEVQRIRSRVAGVAEQFYGDDEW